MTTKPAGTCGLQLVASVIGNRHFLWADRCARAAFVHDPELNSADSGNGSDPYEKSSGTEHNSNKRKKPAR